MLMGIASQVIEMFHLGVQPINQLAVNAVYSAAIGAAGAAGSGVGAGARASKKRGKRGKKREKYIHYWTKASRDNSISLKRQVCKPRGGINGKI